MNIDKEQLEDHQIKLTVALDATDFENTKRRVAKKLSRHTKIPGFRPGKAPYNLIVRHLGEPAIIEEAVDTTVHELYPEVIDQAEVKPYGPGQLQEITQLDPPIFEFIVPLAPEVELMDYQDLRFDYEEPETTTEDLENTLKNVLDSRAKTEPVDRPAEISDLVQISLSGQRQVPDSEKTEELIQELRAPVVIEKDESAEEWPFPGFSHALVGLSKGEEKTAQFTYPEDHPDEQFSGKTVDFTFVVQEVNSRELPELNDEFAQSLGNYEDMEGLRADLQERLVEQSLESYRNQYRDQILDALIADSAFRFPPQMVEDEIDTLIDQFKNRLANQGMDIDTYLKTQQSDEKTLRDEFLPVAKERIQRGLVLLEVANKEEIKVDDSEVQKEVEQSLGMLSQSMSAADGRKYLNEDIVRGLIANAMRDSLTEKTLTHLSLLAKGELEEGEADLEAELPTADAPEDEAIEDPSPLDQGESTEIQAPADDGETEELAEDSQGDPIPEPEDVVEPEPPSLEGDPTSVEDVPAEETDPVSGADKALQTESGQEAEPADKAEPVDETEE